MKWYQALSQTEKNKQWDKAGRRRVDPYGRPLVENGKLLVGAAAWYLYLQYLPHGVFPQARIVQSKNAKTTVIIGGVAISGAALLFLAPVLAF